MRTNSPIDDAAPYEMPEIVPVAAPPKSDWEKVATSKRMKQIDAYIDARIKEHQTFLPGGTPVLSLTEKERMAHWGNALVVIDELEGIRRILQAGKAK